jgi:hypothetical protein
MTKDVQSPPKRQAVLIVADGDYIEVFGEAVDVHVAKLPQAGSREMGDVAEQCLELALPHRYRSLFDRSKLRCNAVIRPLSPIAALQALATKQAVVALNRLQDALKDAREGDAA